MILSAIKSGYANYILPVEKMAELIIAGFRPENPNLVAALQDGVLKALLPNAGVQKIDVLKTGVLKTVQSETIDSKTSSLPINALSNSSHKQSLMSDQKNLQQKSIESPLSAQDLVRILMHLRTVTGQDFSLYKKSTIGRRIERRMLQHNIDNAEVYLRYLKENPAEAHILFKELLINVTSFFRDTEAFTVLQKEVLPQLCKDKPSDYIFRVWVAGCATGEEAYSIAILLSELENESHQAFKVQIYSTDLDDHAIAIARAGIYSANIVQDVSPERLRRYFVKEDTGYRIKKEIREMILFAVHNVIKDPPFTKLDLLTCRNLMIYLEPELQNTLIPVFHYALKQDGVMFLSPSESIGNHAELFTPINRKWKFYTAMHSTSSTRTLITTPLAWVKGSHSRVVEETMIKNKDTDFKEPNFGDITRKLLIQYFAPASVIINLKGDILFVHGDTGKYLRPAPGEASLNIVEMAREGLERELRSAIHLANVQGIPTINREMQVKTNGGFTTVGLSVRPLPKLESGAGSTNDHANLLLISFQDIATPIIKTKNKGTIKASEAGRVAELENELEFTKENLQTTIMEQQTFNEELKSTNEELQSTNEELQSTNEELETSKEELQSVNEELITVNAELQSKIEQLAGMQNDMKNLHDNMNIGIIFLDQHMSIRRFTRDATKVYRLVQSDLGRRLADIKSDLISDDQTDIMLEESLLNQAQSVLETLVSFEREVQTNKGVCYLLRIQPYRTLDNVIEGVVLTFTDITQRVKAEIAVKHALELSESIVDTISEPLLVLDANLQIVSANRAFCQYFQVTSKDTSGRKIYDLGNRQWNIAALRELLETILPRDQTFEGYVVEHDFPNIGHRKMMLNARRIDGKLDEPSLILLAMEEVKTVSNKVSPS
ncbi:MAG: PAS domain-containing protein [Bacteroidia bacterium]|nr:PAS domain-containing protein [Methylotenera sp.]